MASPRRGQALSALLCEADPAEAARRLRAAAAAAADLAALLDRDPGRLRPGGGVMFTHPDCILSIENRYVRTYRQPEGLVHEIMTPSPTARAHGGAR